VGSKGSPGCCFSAAAAAISSASASFSRGTSIRVWALQVWPELRKQLATPWEIAPLRSASSRITFADLPPSSSETLFTVPAATSLTSRPARVEPVNETMSIPSWAAIASPTTGPYPVTRLKAPGGRPSESMISASTNELSGVTSLGFTTTAQPAASAGATLAQIWWRG